MMVHEWMRRGKILNIFWKKDEAKSSTEKRRENEENFSCNSIFFLLLFVENKVKIKIKIG